MDANALVSIYNSEQDPHIKNSILDSLMGQRNAKALIDIVRQEKDQKDEAAHRGAPLQHEGQQGSAGLSRGAVEEMKLLLCLMSAALPLAAQPKLLVNAKLDTRPASAGLEQTFRPLVTAQPQPAWIG